MALIAPDWLAPPATNASEPEGRSELDIEMDGPWFLAPNGIFSRDCSRAHNSASTLTSMALVAPNWLAPPATNTSEAEGRSELDIEMDSPWFLASDGICPETAHDVAESLPGETLPVSDTADFFVQSALTFTMILKYLPNVPRLNSNYRRRTDGTWRLFKDLYFVVENHDFCLGTARVYLAAKDPWLTIQVALSQEEAEKLIEKHINLQHRA
ncbi:hypothetical protein B0H14DRAFT_3536181 [Mycena olivaceomarginata]|nr:hypothetical protein B0H14DRAFT_3536181 [Mycena olivaceomarginata]